MIKFSSQKINTHTDTLQSAIHKKRNNKELSNKTLSKLTKIINAQFKFHSTEVNYVFGSKLAPKDTNYHSISKFIKSIQKLTTQEKDTLIYPKINKWQANAIELHSRIKPVENMEKRIGRGGRSHVYHDGQFVIKQLKKFNLGEAKHEVAMCNAYRDKTHSISPNAFIVGERITMPFVHGQTPNKIETLNGIKDLYDKGFLMAGAKPENFLKIETGQIVPIDFGLIFKANNLSSIDQNVKIEIVRDYIKGGYHYIPSSLKSEYTSHIKALDSMLGSASPMRYINTKELSNAGVFTINRK